jgi:single-stranded-DNA-specific exonuclease
MAFKRPGVRSPLAPPNFLSKIEREACRLPFLHKEIMALKRWKEIEPDERAHDLAREKSLSLTEAVLLSRLLHSSLESAYFSGRPLVFPGTGSLANLDSAAERIAETIRRNEKILVHGDYDTDGLMGTSILIGGLTALGASVKAFIPSRFEDGYGLSSASIEAAKKYDARLVVTVDCGTNARDIEEGLSASGIDLLVTDHHIPEDNNLVQGIVVNPHFGGDDELKTLAGATVAYLLLRATAAKMGANIPEEPFVRLCAIATISDVVPISPFNWKLCREGFKTLSDTNSPGLAALLYRCPQPPYRSHHIAYYLAPRLNAAGRMEDGNLVLEILLERDLMKARHLVEKLETLNENRRFIQNQMAEEIEKHFGDDNDIPFLFCASDRFHKGLLGPVASRLAQERGKSVFLVAVEGDKATGSARSADNCDLTALLRRSEGVFTRLGGHEKAAGFTMLTKNISLLRDFLEISLTGNGEVEPAALNYFSISPDQAQNVWNFLGTIDPIYHSLQTPYFAFELSGLPNARTIKDKHLLWNIPLPGGLSFSAFYFDAVSKIEGVPSKDRMIVGRLLPDKMRTNPNFFFEVKDII